MECKFCKNEINEGAIKCDKCGTWLNNKRTIELSSMLLSLLIALISIISLAAGSFYEFYKDHLQVKEVDLNIRIVEANPNYIDFIVKNNGTADAYFSNTTAYAEMSYFNDKEGKKIEAKMYYNYKAMKIESPTDFSNFSSSIIPSNGYRVLRMNRDHSSSKVFRKELQGDDIPFKISINPKFVNLNTGQDTKNFVLEKYRHKGDLMKDKTSTFLILLKCYKKDEGEIGCYNKSMQPTANASAD